MEFPARHELELGVTAAFLARVDATERLLADRGLPWPAARFLPGRTLVVVAYQQFTDSPVGPYRQVSVSIPMHARLGRAEASPPPAAGAPVPVLPLLTQSLWNTERMFTDLHFYVAAIPVSEPAAVNYSKDIWAEPAWLASVAAARSVPGPRGSRRARLEITVSSPEGSPDQTFLRMAVRVGGLPITERRGYRLVGRQGDQWLTDVMRIEAPAHLAFGPGRAVLEPGDAPPAGFLREIAGERPVAVQTLIHRPGNVTFGGPAASCAS